MNMISARVLSDCIGCGDEDDNSHDSTISHGIIKLRYLVFVYLEYALSSGEKLHIVPLITLICPPI